MEVVSGWRSDGLVVMLYKIVMLYKSKKIIVVGEIHVER